MSIEDLVNPKVEDEEEKKDVESGTETETETGTKDEQVGIDDLVAPNKKKSDEEKKDGSWTTSLPKKYRAAAESYNDLGSYLEFLLGNQKPAQEEEDVWTETHSNIVPKDDQVIDDLFKKVKESGVNTTQAKAILSGVQEAIKAEHQANVNNFVKRADELIKSEGITGQKRVDFKEKIDYLAKTSPELYQDAVDTGIIYHPFVVSLINNSMSNVKEGKLIRTQNSSKPKTVDDNWEALLSKHDPRK